MTLLKKIHKITTYIAVFSGFLMAVVIFLFFVDEFLRLNIFGRAFEPLLAIVAALGGVLFGVAAMISILLSLYLFSQKN